MVKTLPMRNLNLVPISLFISFIGLGFFLLWIAFASPDQELLFERKVPVFSHLSMAQDQLSDLSQWPKWFHSLESAKRIDSESQTLEAGSKILLQINPKRSFKKKFQILVEIISHDPRQFVKIKVLRDSTGRLKKLFDVLEWEISIDSSNSESTQRRSFGPIAGQVTGKARAHTHHWKSRLFGTLSRKILMNQVYYPDLFRLAQVKTAPSQSPFFPPQAQ